MLRDTQQANHVGREQSNKPDWARRDDDGGGRDSRQNKDDILRQFRVESQACRFDFAEAEYVEQMSEQHGQQSDDDEHNHHWRC